MKASGQGRALVIMPAYNEAQNIAPVIAGVRQNAPELDIVVVNDCSTDRTAQVAAEAGAIVLSLPCNLGYGGAVQAGFRYAVERGYAFGVIMDADGQHNPADVPRLLETVRHGEADLALGSRFLGRLEYSPSWPRRLGMALFRWLASRVTGQRITDPTSGFQAMTREVMRFFARDNYPVDFPDADTIMTLHFAGFHVREVPVTMRARLSGESMHTTWKSLYYVFKMFLSIFIVWLRQRTNSHAVRPGQEPAT
jgi:glycosyltransferase involved in cell wall biosynthesis